MEIIKREFDERVEYGYWKGEDWVLHREDGPANEYANGNKFWYYHGVRHREDGPASIWSSSTKFWYYYGTPTKDENEFYSEEFRQRALLNLIQ